MPSTAWRQPVRRSPLEPVHIALGAIWPEDAARWPTTYGDEVAEAAALAETAAIAEIGPIDKLVIRGRQTEAALHTLGVSVATRAVVKGEGPIQAWCLADDEAMLLVPGSHSAATGSATAELVERVETIGATVTDLSSGINVLRLAGPAAPSILVEACAVDTSPAALDQGDIVQASMAGVRVSLARQDHSDAPAYTLLVARDQAEYLWESLRMLGAPHGLAAVGSDVVGTMPGAVADGST